MRPTTNSLLLAGILLGALVIRLVEINGQAFFVDEVYEIKLAHRPAAEIIDEANAMPPLYPLLLKGWLGIWGSDAAARWLSALCGVTSIVCVWGSGRRLVNDATGLAAAFITALLPLHVYYSQFVRSYALLFLLVALDLWLLLRAADTDRWRDWTSFSVIAALGCYTHYYFVIFLATSVCIVVLQRRRLWFGRRALIAYVGAAALAAPLLGILKADLTFQQNTREPRTVSLATLGYTYFSLFSGYTLGPAKSELQTMTGRQALAAAAPWIAAVGAVILCLGYHGLGLLRERRALAVVVTLIALPIPLLAAMSIAGRVSYNDRYVFWCLIGAALWLGAGLVAGGNRWLVRIAMGVLVLLSAAAVCNRHAVLRYQHEDLRGAAAWIHANGSPDDNIYIVSDYLADTLRYYLGEGWKVVELPVPGEVNHVVRDDDRARAARQAVETRSPPGRQIWVVYSRPFHADPTALLLKHFSESLGLAVEVELAGVTVYHGRR
jgi:hypothetical protein